MGGIGFTEIILILVVAILIYGKDLPAVARKVGSFYVKLRRHLTDVRDEISRQIPAEDFSVDTGNSSGPDHSFRGEDGSDEYRDPYDPDDPYAYPNTADAEYQEGSQEPEPGQGAAPEKEEKTTEGEGVATSDGPPTPQDSPSEREREAGGPEPMG